MWGKLSWEAVPFHEPIVMVTSAVVAIAITGVLAWVIVKGYLPYIWKEWLSSVDHKRIGVMYIFLAMVMLLRGFTDAIMMRSQQALAFRAHDEQERALQVLGEALALAQRVYVMSKGQIVFTGSAAQLQYNGLQDDIGGSVGHLPANRAASWPFGDPIVCGDGLREYAEACRLRKVKGTLRQAGVQAVLIDARRHAVQREPDRFFGLEHHGRPP